MYKKGCVEHTMNKEAELTCKALNYIALSLVIIELLTGSYWIFRF